MILIFSKRVVVLLGNQSLSMLVIPRLVQFMKAPRYLASIVIVQGDVELLPNCLAVDLLEPSGIENGSPFESPAVSAVICDMSVACDEI